MTSISCCFAGSSLCCSATVGASSISSPQHPSSLRSLTSVPQLAQGISTYPRQTRYPGATLELPQPQAPLLTPWLPRAHTNLPSDRLLVPALVHLWPVTRHSDHAVFCSEGFHLPSSPTLFSAQEFLHGFFFCPCWRSSALLSVACSAATWAFSGSFYMPGPLYILLYHPETLTSSFSIFKTYRIQFPHLRKPAQSLLMGYGSSVNLPERGRGWLILMPACLPFASLCPLAWCIFLC